MPFSFFQIVINSFGITDASQNSIGTGVFLAASIFDHSCSPNAFVTFEGTSLAVRSLIDWDDFKLEKVSLKK